MSRTMTQKNVNSVEARDGAGIRRPKEARRGDDKEAAGGRIMGKIGRKGRQ